MIAANAAAVTRIYLVRHGQVVGHDEYRYNGHHDVDITEVGTRQMQRLADFLADSKISSVYSSDLQRSVKGAEIIAERLCIDGPTQLTALRELHLGRWEGLTKAEAVALYPEDESFSFQDLPRGRITGGEDLTELGQRVIPAINDIISNHRGEHVLVVAHGGVNRVILFDAIGLAVDNFFRIEQDYGCLNLIDYFPGGNRVVKMVNAGPNQMMGKTEIY